MFFMIKSDELIPVANPVIPPIVTAIPESNVRSYIVTQWSDCK